MCISIDFANIDEDNKEWENYKWEYDIIIDIGINIWMLEKKTKY